MNANIQPETLPKNYKLIKKIGNRISVIRDVRTLSRIRLSEMTKISIQDLREYEAGNKSMTIDELATIADVLEIGAFHFFL